MSGIHAIAECGDRKALMTLLNSRSSAVHERDEWGNTALHFAASAGHLLSVHALIEAKASVESRSDNGSTPAHLAAARGHLAVLELLAALNSPLEAEDALGRTVMQMAVDSGNQAIVASLAKREREQATAFHSQLRRQETTISSSGSSVSMMAAGPIGLGPDMPVPYATNVDAEAYDVGCTAVEGSARAARQSRLADILQAVENDDMDGLRVVLASAPELATGTTSQGQTPAHFAASLGNSAMLKFLLAFGASPNTQDSHGQSALHKAASAGRTEVARFLLIEHGGASVMLPDKMGATPLHHAAAGGHTDVLRLILTAGASSKERQKLMLMALDKNNRTALDVAQRQARLKAAQILKDALTLHRNDRAGIGFISDGQAKAQRASNKAAGLGPLTTAEVVMQRCSNVSRGIGSFTVCLPLTFKRTCLHFMDVEWTRLLALIAKRGSLELVSVYLDNGGRPNTLIDRLDRTVLHLVVNRSNKAAVYALIDAGANPNLACAVYDWKKVQNSRSPLCLAAAVGASGCLAALIDSGARINFTSAFDRRTPLHHATRKGDQRSISVLLAHGADPDALDSKQQSSIDIAILQRDRESLAMLRTPGVEVVLSGMEAMTILQLLRRHAVGTDDDDRLDVDLLLLRASVTSLQEMSNYVPSDLDEMEAGPAAVKAIGMYERWQSMWESGSTNFLLRAAAANDAIDALVIGGEAVMERLQTAGVIAGISHAPIESQIYDAHRINRATITVDETNIVSSNDQSDDTTSAENSGSVGAEKMGKLSEDTPEAAIAVCAATSRRRELQNISGAPSWWEGVASNREAHRRARFTDAPSDAAGVAAEMHAAALPKSIRDGNAGLNGGASVTIDGNALVDEDLRSLPDSPVDKGLYKHLSVVETNGEDLISLPFSGDRNLPTRHLDSEVKLPRSMDQDSDEWALELAKSGKRWAEKFDNHGHEEVSNAVSDEGDPLGRSPLAHTKQGRRNPLRLPSSPLRDLPAPTSPSKDETDESAQALENANGAVPHEEQVPTPSEPSLISSPRKSLFVDDPGEWAASQGFEVPAAMLLRPAAMADTDSTSRARTPPLQPPGEEWAIAGADGKHRPQRNVERSPKVDTPTKAENDQFLPPLPETQQNENIVDECCTEVPETGASCGSGDDDAEIAALEAEVRYLQAHRASLESQAETASRSMLAEIEPTADTIEKPTTDDSVPSTSTTQVASQTAVPMWSDLFKANTGDVNSWADVSKPKEGSLAPAAPAVYDDSGPLWSDSFAAYLKEPPRALPAEPSDAVDDDAVESVKITRRKKKRGKSKRSSSVSSTTSRPSGTRDSFADYLKESLSITTQDPFGDDGDDDDNDDGTVPSKTSAKELSALADELPDLMPPTPLSWSEAEKRAAYREAGLIITEPVDSVAALQSTASTKEDVLPSKSSSWSFKDAKKRFAQKAERAALELKEKYESFKIKQLRKDKSVIVTGAGTNRVNGKYVPVSIPNYSSTATPFGKEGEPNMILLRWMRDHWFLVDMGPDIDKVPGAGATEYYRSMCSDAAPPAEGWHPVDGAIPAPTLQLEAASGAVEVGSLAEAVDANSLSTQTSATKTVGGQFDNDSERAVSAPPVLVGDSDKNYNRSIESLVHGSRGRPLNDSDHQLAAVEQTSPPRKKPITTIDDAPRVNILLSVDRRGSSGLGFSLAPALNPTRGVRVVKVTPGGLTHTQGIRVGFEIIEINGHFVKGLGLSDVSNLLKAAGDILTFRLSVPTTLDPSSLSEATAAAFDKAKKSMAIDTALHKSGPQVQRATGTDGAVAEEGAPAVAHNELSGPLNVNESQAEVATLENAVPSDNEDDCATAVTLSMSAARVVTITRRVGSEGGFGFVLQPASHLLSTLSAAAGAKGVQVKEVESSSAADKAGVRKGDLILAINGTGVANAALRDVVALLAESHGSVEFYIRSPTEAQVQ